MSSPGFDAGAFNAFEAAGWEERAGAYHSFFAPITSRVIPTLLAGAGVEAGRRLLDVGSGPGYITAAGREAGADVVGIDVAHDMVEVARRLHPGTEFRQADAEQLPFADDAFDAVTGNFALLHLGRPERATAEFARVLAPGGRLALSVWDVPQRCRLVGVFVDAVADVGVPPPATIPAGPPMFRFSDEDEFAGLLSAAGLVDVDVRTCQFTHHVADADTLWDGLVDGTVRTRALVMGHPDETQRAIRAAFGRRAGAHGGEGGLDIPVSVKVASGRKAGGT